MSTHENSLLELKNYKERLSIALKASHICIFEVDLRRQLYTFFENSEDIFGVSGEKILEDVQPYSKLDPDEYQKAVSKYFSHPDDTDIIDEAFKRIFSGKPATYQARMKAGQTNYIWCKIDVTPTLENGIPVSMIGVITDINQVKSQIDGLQQCARIDSFTGLYIKDYAEGVIKEILKKQTNQRHALILIDLDNFKFVNDTYGHMAGDQVLKSISDRLKQTFRKSDIISRFGGDEFVIFIPDISSLQKLASKMKSLLNAGDNGFAVTKSIGVSIFPDDATTFKKLFETADKALYKAKQTKNSYAFFSEPGRL